MLLAVFSPLIAAQTLSMTPEYGINQLIKSDGATMSEVWSGYALSEPNHSVTDVIGSWKVPSVTGSNGISAFWVGIDGYTSPTVEQIGTTAEIVNGQAKYYAWYEWYPAGPQTITSVTVRPGDIMIGTAQVTSTNPTTIEVSIYDVTNGDEQAHYTNSSTTWDYNSAEWIAECPSGYYLPNFGTVYFGQDYTSCIPSCEATVSGTSGYIGSFGSAVEQITMYADYSPYPVMATPSALSSDGSSFSITWNSAGP